MAEKEERHLSWDEIHEKCVALAEQVQSGSDKFKGLVAVATGGLTPTHIIAKILGIKEIHAACISTYEDENPFQRAKAVIHSLPLLEDEGAGYLFIDDMIDSGRTFDILRLQYPKAKFACLYAKERSLQLADFMVEKMRENGWLVFPWEARYEKPAEQNYDVPRPRVS
ncbi:MAG: hypothetical protein GC136_08630 [Alphaproteobacteria bacterium]|nr:hypothetical protein [Alphaproteobacteria bacterium]